MDVVRNPMPIGAMPVIPTVPVQIPELPVLTMDTIDVNSLPEMERFTVELKKDIYGLGITIAGYVCEKGNASRARKDYRICWLPRELFPTRGEFGLRRLAKFLFHAAGLGNLKRAPKQHIIVTHFVYFQPLSYVRFEFRKYLEVWRSELDFETQEACSINLLGRLRNLETRRFDGWSEVWDARS